LSKGKRLPCILDVKIGLNKSKPGRNREITTTEILKFRLCGMHVQLEDGTSIFKDKYWGRKVTIETLPKLLLLFFWNGNFSIQTNRQRSK